MIFERLPPRHLLRWFLAGESLYALSRLGSEVRSRRLGPRRPQAADLLQEYEVKIAALERMVGRQAPEIEFLKGTLKNAPRPRNVNTSVIAGPAASPSQKGAGLMGIGRSTFYDTLDARARDLTIVAKMKAICDEFEVYGYRRVDAERHHRGIVVNAKKIRRLMREHALNPKQRRRFRDDG